MLRFRVDLGYPPIWQHVPLRDLDHSGQAGQEMIQVGYSVDLRPLRRSTFSYLSPLRKKIRVAEA